MLLILILAVAGPVRADERVRVEWKDGLITIAAEATPRAAVLSAIGRETGIEVVGLDAMAEERVTLRMTRVPLLDAVRRLLGDVPAVLMEERASDGELRLVSVRLFERSRPRPRADDEPDAGPGVDMAAREAAERDTLEAADATTLRQALLQTEDEERAQAALEVLEARAPAATISTLLVAARSTDTGQRLHALKMLDRVSSADGATAIAALDQAATDDDDTIRGFAIGALAMRGAGGLSVLRRTFRGAERDVRLMVLQAVSRGDGDSALLREALTDPDAQVRQFATSRLSRSGTPGGG